MLAARDAVSAATRVQTYLDGFRRNYDYKAVVMTSRKGAVLLSAPQTASGPLDAQTKALVAKATATGRVESSGLYQDAEGTSLLDLVAPILGADGSAIATVILRSDLDGVLYPLIQHWPLPSQSGENLLVERHGDQVVFLNELRHRKNTAFTLTAPLNTLDLPAAMAVRGRRGIAQGVDYRSVPVLSAVQPVPGTPWFIIAKEDTDEVLAAIRARGWLTAGFALLLVALAGTQVLLAEASGNWPNQAYAFSAVVGAGDLPKTVTAVDHHVTKSVQLAVGEMLTVELPGNSSTGYAWTVSPLAAPGVIEQVGDIAYTASTGLMGAPGVFTAQFKGVGAGSVPLMMLYQGSGSAPTVDGIWMTMVTVQ
jgi:predicted secreted protein